MLARRLALLAAGGWCVALGLAQPAEAQSWPGYGRDAQHSALGSIASQPPQTVIWSTPVDLMPQYSGNDLFIHYGSPLVTRLNTVLVTVKTQVTDGFRVDAHRGSNGQLVWSLNTDYVTPPHNWTPPCTSTLTPKDASIVVPAAGGTVLVRGYPDNLNSTLTRRAFFGINNYNANPAAFNGTIFICTPITADRLGNLFFGFYAGPGAPLGLVSGFARISTTGVGTWVSAATASGDSNIKKPAYNCAPAISADNSTVYVAVNNSDPGGWGTGYLLALDTSNLALKHRVVLKDVAHPNNLAFVIDDGTASPTVGPDGDVYFGVLENPFPSNHDRGWLLHFSADLATSKTPGAFGWDDTASVVPANIVPSYQGNSSYLLLTKYNNYAGVSGDGVNKLAVLDPDATQVDPITGATVMKEVLTVKGVTPDPEFVGNHPNAVREWCINTAAIDPIGKCAIVNSEDGAVYRWDFTTNTLTSKLQLAPATGEAYTPTVIGPDGTVFAINNATLFCCGRAANMNVNSKRPRR